MAKLRVFISSTFYDLKYVRSSIEGFVERMGYEPTLSENGRIAYDPDIPLDESCYREASTADIFVLIVGGRYGSLASDDRTELSGDFYERYESITKKEYESAAKREIPMYILVESQVMSEFETYRKNKNNKNIDYAHVDSVNVFRFLDIILSRRRNNPVYQFSHYNEIESWLKEQWSGYFRELINRRSESKQLLSLNDKVAELSAINTSLQRYLEEVVSSLSTPEKAQEIIKSEHKKLLEEKVIREFSSISLVRELVDFGNLNLEEVIEAYGSAKSLENLAEMLGEISSGFVNADAAVDHWKRNPDVVDRINNGRSILGKSRLDFE